MKSAYWQPNNNGHTLIELLLVLTLSILLLSLLPNFIIAVSKNYETQTLTLQQVTMFFNQVAQDVKSSTNVEIGEQSILLKRSGRKDIEIKLLETGQIRRTSDGEGNVLFLENVQAFKCLKNNLAMSCTLSSKGGEQFKRSIFIHYAIKVTTFE